VRVGILILSHGRADNVKTWALLDKRRSNLERFSESIGTDGKLLGSQLIAAQIAFNFGFRSNAVDLVEYDKADFWHHCVFTVNGFTYEINDCRLSVIGKS
jgi:hypothetical protein